MTEQEIQESIRGHDTRNAELLRTLQDEGVALDVERSVDHHFWSSGQMSAALLGKELYASGYLILEMSPPQDNSGWWNVEAGMKRTPNEAASHNLTETLVRLAARFDSVYDGWGTSI